MRRYMGGLGDGNVVSSERVCVCTSLGGVVNKVFKDVEKLILLYVCRSILCVCQTGVSGSCNRQLTGVCVPGVGGVRKGTKLFNKGFSFGCRKRRCGFGLPSGTKGFISFFMGWGCRSECRGRGVAGVCGSFKSDVIVC